MHIQAYMPFPEPFKNLCACMLVVLMAACTSAPAQAPAPMPIPAPAHAPVDLQSHTWNLVAAFDGQGAVDPGWRVTGHAPLELVFAHGQLLVHGLCNMLGASYTQTSQRLSVGHPISTKRACADRDWMRLEERVGTRLPQLRRYQLHPARTPRLELFFADGSRWEMSGTPTAQTRYGGAAERIFLEVAPEKMACSDGVARNAQCLRVREIHYDANGVRQSMGEWHAFYGAIDGYTHTPGMRSVLRIDRFKRQNAPADASAYAYVLDMVVESERVRP